MNAGSGKDFDKDRDLAGLDAHVDALRAAAPSAAAADAAQQRLLARVASAQPPARRTWSWAPAGAFAALALALIVAVPMLSMRPALAFADVQRHFRDFRTMVVNMTTRAGGGPVMTTVIRANDRGNVRVDVNDTLSVIVNAEQKQVLHLMHMMRVGRIEPLAVAPTRDDALGWIDELRAFQGQATLLPDTREIDGRMAHGWQLELQGVQTTLWATAEGLPLAMDVANGTLVDIDFRFEFDGELPADTFSMELPDGYRM